MSRIEELPDDFDESLKLHPSSPAQPRRTGLSSHAPGSETPFPIPAKERDEDGSMPVLPPQMESVRSHSADEIVRMMNQTPLFMTSLENTDTDDGENIGLEAIRALQYEGTRAEVAQGFKERGNEMIKEKRWKDAKKFYSQGLRALVQKVDATEQSVGDMPPSEEKEKEGAKERKVEEALYVNRALCNLELQNYRSTTLDCASVLRLNPHNLKAYYRSSLALLALSKLPEAFDACTRGLALDPANSSLKSLYHNKLQPREEELRAKAEKQTALEKRAMEERTVLTVALKARGIRLRTTKQPPDMEDAKIHLSPDPIAPESALLFPVLLLYPLHAQSDFIKAFSETDTIPQHLEYIFPLPWDTPHEYDRGSVESYMETITGGLIKVGKNMSLLRVLSSGKVEIVDGLVRINILLKDRASQWIEEVKARKPKS